MQGSQQLPELLDSDQEWARVSEDPSDEDYEPEPLIIGERKVAPSTMRAILELHEKGRTEVKIQKVYRWYRRQYLQKFRDFLEHGSRPADKLDLINRRVAEQFQEARRKGQPVRGFMIKAWALQTARRLHHERFKASNHWLTNFKKKLG